MRKNYIARMLLLPIIVALVTTLSILLIEREAESDLMPLSMFENLMLFVMLYLAIYFFTIVLAAPINIYISKKIKNKIVSIILFNIIGLMLIGCIDAWFLTIVDLMSVYLIFPLFSLLALIPFKIEWND
ncbi:pilus assembly protein PilB [Lysinibacillus yapensis]|uniref:Pilus assembly protein PilB n=1 Tax=Ureibacillus yapensis TaxID=2304605 RepID=A0A396S4F4_9BACL|nr:pilus assembly protein PilB [Lysinibacillus yapensis]RHW34032.1 pilus assembly protein PilB [Lysinibacillus yapensis]